MEIPLPIDDGLLVVRSIVTAPLENNVYLAASAATGEGVVIDAAAEAERILEMAAPFGIVAVIATHGHHDHVGAAREVSAALDVPFRIHPADAGMAGLDPDVPLADGEIIDLGGVALETLHTPGHTPGSTSLVTGHLLFSGDTLFPGGPGSTSGPAADFPTIMRSLREKLFTLPDETVVLPGHGSATTIGAERPFLDEWEARGW
jgi:glyoxylase-like metal-dependent hydrolase (beta-lactamase superfamily II)